MPFQRCRIETRKSRYASQAVGQCGQIAAVQYFFAGSRTSEKSDACLNEEARGTDDHTLIFLETSGSQSVGSDMLQSGVCMAVQLSNRKLHDPHLLVNGTVLLVSQISSVIAGGLREYFDLSPSRVFVALLVRPSTS